MSRSASSTLLRWTSVGCAVSTGEMCARASVCAVSLLLMPASASRWKVMASDPSWTRPARSW